MRTRHWLILIAGGLWCAACAPSSRLPALPADEVAAERRKQEIAQLQDYYAQLRRVESVAFHIRVSNRDACGAWVNPMIGLHAATPRSLPKKFQSFSAEALGLRWVRATVIAVVDGSPAAVAGIRNGDELLSFNEVPVPVYGTMGWIGGFMVANAEQPVEVRLHRDDDELKTIVHPVRACAIPVNLETNPEAGAFTNFRKIVIQSGILRVTRSDADLAAIIGHELAHVTMGHYQKKLVNTTAGQLAGAAIDGGFLVGGIYTDGAFSSYLGVAGGRLFSPDFEREADYVGAYYAARAGYDISGTADIWRAMSLEHPNSIRLATTHPTSPVRYVQMKKVAEEIADKKRRGLPLIPDLKPTYAEAPVSPSLHQ
ncbi:MAG: M48 family metalloprotease [Pseudolabrys sp.]